MLEYAETNGGYMTENVLLSEEGEQRRIRTVTRWLENVSRAVERRFDFEAQAGAMRAMADNLRGIDYSAVQVATSPTPDAIPDAIIAAEEMGELYGRLRDDAVRRVAQAESALSEMDNQDGARALSLYYLTFDASGKRRFDTWEKVCVEMHYSEDGMKALVRRAKLELYDLMPHTERPKVERAL